MNLWTAGSWYLPRIYPIYTVCENDSFDTSGRIHISSRYIVSTSATSAMPKPCATSEAIPFSSGDSHIKFGDTSCFLKKLLVYFPSPECLAYPRTGQSAKSVADKASLWHRGWTVGRMATISCCIIGTNSMFGSLAEYEPNIRSYDPFFNPSTFAEVIS